MVGEYDFSDEDPSGFSGQDYGGYDTSGYDPYGSYYDYQDQPDYSGYTGLDYTQQPDQGGGGGGFTGLDYGGVGGNGANTSYSGAYEPGVNMMGENSGLLHGLGNDPTQDYSGFSGVQYDEPSLMDKIYGKVQGKFSKDPLGALAGLTTFGTQVYGAMQEKKDREALAKQMKDAKAAREARLAKYGAVLPLKMNRQMLDPGRNLLTAGQQGGALNWFSPTTFTPMAEGGSTSPGWLERIASAFRSRTPEPALVGTGGAANAANAIMQQQYQRYAVGQQMNDQEPLPYEAWVAGRQQGRAHGGLTYAHGGGQDDVVDIKAAPGEYVFDSDVVSALGDGNNAEGARKLDAMREHIRQHKRSAPASEIPPRARSLESYMRGGK